MISPHGLERQDVVIAKERVEALLAPDSPALRDVDEVIDADGLILFSGIFDTHVHFETGTSHLDTLQNATRAAALGGTTTIIGHVRSPEGNLVAEVERQQSLVVDCPIDVAFHAIISQQDDVGKVVPALVERGVRSFKFFMPYADSGLGLDDRALYEAFEVIGRHGGVAVVHAEHPGLIAALEDALVATQRTTIPDYPASRPVETEVEAMRRALWLANRAGCPLCFAHVSSPAGLELVIERKAQRLLDANAHSGAYAECCPKYLLLNDGAYETLGGKAVVAPPLRSSEDQQALFESFLSGGVDVLGSDHSPHALEEKKGTSFLDVRAGAPGAQTFFPVLVSRVLEAASIAGTGSEHDERSRWHRRRVDPLFALQLAASYGPAKLFGLSPRKGRIAVGADADFVFVDPRIAWSVTQDWLVSNAGFSLYENRELKGRAMHTMVRGRWVLRDGELVRRVGGQYMPR